MEKGLKVEHFLLIRIYCYEWESHCWYCLNLTLNFFIITLNLLPFVSIFYEPNRSLWFGSFEKVIKWKFSLFVDYHPETPLAASLWWLYGCFSLFCIMSLINFSIVKQNCCFFFFFFAWFLDIFRGELCMEILWN